MLFKTLVLCRNMYNKLLQELNKQKKVNIAAVRHKVKEFRKEDPELQKIYAAALHYEAYRLKSNLRGLARLKKKGYDVGALKPRLAKNSKTFCYQQHGFELIKRPEKKFDILKLSKIGDVKVRAHQDIQGKIKMITIYKKIKHWEALISTDDDIKRTKGKKKIGIDVGIKSFLVTSEGERIDNPLFYKQQLDKLKKLQRIHSKKKKGSHNRRKAGREIARLYEKIDRQKKDFFHKVTKKLINDCSVIVMEKLDIKNMTDKKKNKDKKIPSKIRKTKNRNTLDSSWYLFKLMLKIKAETAGVEIIEVNPAYTSQTCSECGFRQKMPLDKRVFNCQKCGIIIDRDHNAAKNIYARSLACVETH